MPKSLANLRGHEAAERYIQKYGTQLEHPGWMSYRAFAKVHGGPPPPRLAGVGGDRSANAGPRHAVSSGPGGVLEPGNDGIEPAPSTPAPLRSNPETSPAPESPPRGSPGSETPSTSAAPSIADAVSNFVNSNGRAGGQSDGPGAPESTRVPEPAAPTPPQLVDKPAAQLLSQKYKGARG